MKYKIQKTFCNYRWEYHILRTLDDSLLDVELTYGEAWVRMLVYENLEK